jgi:hypothetical protein
VTLGPEPAGAAWMANEAASKTVKYDHRTSKIGLKVDATNVAYLLDLLDDSTRNGDDRARG